MAKSWESRVWGQQVPSSGATYWTCSLLPLRLNSKAALDFWTISPPAGSWMDAEWVLKAGASVLLYRSPHFVLLQMLSEAISWLEHRPPQSVCTGRRENPPSAQTTKLSVASKGSRYTKGSLKRVDNSGDTWPLMVWLSTSPDSVKDKSLWLQQTPISHSPEIFISSLHVPFWLLTFRSILTISVCVYVCYVHVHMHTYVCSADVQVP